MSKGYKTESEQKHSFLWYVMYMLIHLEFKIHEIFPWRLANLINKSALAIVCSDLQISGGNVCCILITLRMHEPLFVVYSIQWFCKQIVKALIRLCICAVIWRREGSTGMDMWNAPMVQSRQLWHTGWWKARAWEAQDNMEAVEWKLSAIDPNDRYTWRSGVRSAVRAAS